MKKLFFALLVTTIAGGSVMAQDQSATSAPTQQDPRQEWDQKVKQELKLTPDQVVKYDALVKEYGPKMDVIAKDATLTEEVRKERKMTLKKEKEAKLFAFLTPEQQSRYKELLEKKKKDTEKS